MVCAAWTPGSAGANEESIVTAVFAKTHNGYVRELAPDGTPLRETYVVGKGTYAPGRREDPSIENVPFSGVVRALAPYLAQKNYVPAPDKQSADLILVLHWGTTLPLNDGSYQNVLNMATGAIRNVQNLRMNAAAPMSLADKELLNVVTRAAENDLFGDLMLMEMENEARRRANEFNANLLGYIGDVNARVDLAHLAGVGTAHNDLVGEIEEERYYVVIGAYDFQEVLKGRHKLLWTTRVSIRAQKNRFDEWLPTMFANASDYFGEESKRLVRRFQRATKVELGELKTLGVVDEREMDSK